MAARDRFGSYVVDASLTPLQRAVHQACDPNNYEPNLALSLEVVDLINSKKGNAPREAAITLVHLINSRNQSVALLALSLLDICVKNCGYPFHLQISTKEFLNELVRRFPERPPLRPSRVQHRTLESIEEWRQTICQTSRYKEDLGFIRDMHRLLLYKGYSFPEVRLEDAAVLNPSDDLRSAEEMEEEEKSAQSAKLQELIRRGGPEDLQEANRLMKVMAGYDTRHKTDYRAKAAEEVAKVQQKAKLLEEMLQSLQPGDKLADGDVFEELSNALQSAHPKIQKMCEEESDDAEAVDKLLQINDSIRRTVERYKLARKGDFEGASKIPKGTLGTTTGVSKNAQNELSLIDFDPEPSSNGNQLGTGAAGATSLENDLLGLSFQDQPGSARPSSRSRITLSPSPPPGPASGVGPRYGLLPSPVPPPRPASQLVAPAGSRPTSKSSVSPPTDPFIALVSSSPRAASPFTAPGATRHPHPTSDTLVDLGVESPTATGGHTAGEEEWTFTSSLPDGGGLPSTNQVRVLNSSLIIDFTIRRTDQPRQIQVTALFSNDTLQALTQLHFQVAVERAYTLQLRPQSGRDIGPQQQNVIQQEMLLDGVKTGHGNAVKMRFRVSYRVGETVREEQGMVPPLGIA